MTGRVEHGRGHARAEALPAAAHISDTRGGSAPDRAAVVFVAILAMSMGAGPLLIYGLTAVGPLVIAELELSRLEFGSLATVAFTAAAVSSALVGRLVDMHSERATMFVLHAGSALALVLAALAQSYVAVLVAVVLSGAVQALSNPVTNRLVSQHVVGPSRGWVMGIKQSGVQMAQLAAGLALPTLALLLGWRGALGMAAALAAAGLVLSATFLPRRVRTPDAPSMSGTSSGLPHAVWWLSAYALLTGAALQGANVYLPLYAYQALHLPLATAGLTAAVVGGVGLVARIAWGRGADRFAAPRSPLLILAVLAAIGTALIFLAEELAAVWLLWFGAAIFGATGIAANVVLMVAVLRVVAAPVIGRASGVLAIGLYLGFAVGPVSFGFLVDATDSYGAGWVAVTITYLSAAGLVIFGRYSTPASAVGAHS